MKKWIFLFAFFSSQLLAEDELRFKPDKWLSGFHLMAGAGVNASIYNSDFERQNQGLGLTLKTDLGYYLDHSWALEASSNVKFNKVEEYLIWDTLLTLGVRYRFHKSHYARAFSGWAPTVFFLDDAPDVYQRSEAKRVQYNGPVLGMAYGKFYQTEKKLIWFVEYAASYQKLANEKGVADESDVPEIVFRSGGSGQVQIYSVYASIGVLVF